VAEQWRKSGRDGRQPGHIVASAAAEQQPGASVVRNVSRPLLTTGTPLSPALELIFARWTPHIVWLLDSGPMRFGDLQRRLVPVGTAMLAQRLRQMEAAGFLQRSLYMRHPPRVEYSLTERGRSLMPLLRAVEEWSTTHLKEDVR
jgi:DNA-binding HxlR family transcriptional regulator